MQRLSSSPAGLLTFSAVLAGLSAGCGPSDTSPTAQATTPSVPAAATVRVWCAEPAWTTAFADRAAGWAGGRVTLVSKPDDADAAVVGPPAVGRWAAKGELASLPVARRAGDNPLQWSRILESYRKRLAGWGEDVQGLPLSGDGFVLVYRSDKFAESVKENGFRQKYGRSLSAPNSWEEFLEVSEFFAPDGPSLPPLPADPHRLLTLFHQVAACYDRKPLGVKDVVTEEQLAFHARLDTGAPRLTAPAFAAAAGWLQATNKYRGGAADPVAALATGTAVVEVLSLAEVARLPKGADGAVEAKFGVARLPGSRSYFDAAGNRLPAGPDGNRVPYLAGGQVGVVFTKATNQEACWDLFASLAALPGSLAAIGNPAAGVGPFRTEHVEAARGQVWLRYGFDADRSRAFAAAVESYVAAGVPNPVIGLRTPDQAELMAALAAEVRACATGAKSPAAALAAADAAWRRIQAATPPATVREWQRKGLGLN